MALIAQRASSDNVALAFVIDQASGRTIAVVSCIQDGATAEETMRLARGAAAADDLALALERLIEDVEGKVHHFPPLMAAATRSRVAFARAALARTTQELAFPPVAAVAASR